MAVIGINYTGAEHDYDENDERIATPGGLVYESVYLHYKGGEKVFNSGNFVKDWYDAKEFFARNLMETEHLVGSSTVGHFIMDGAKFDSAYLHTVDDVPELKYIVWSDEIEKMIENSKIYEDGWEFFVDEGTTPTWDELKEMCRPKIISLN